MPAASTRNVTGDLPAASLVATDLGGLVCEEVRPDERIRLFKSVGMAWEDAVVAAEIVRSVS